MDIFLRLPSEYLRGIVYLSDRSNTIEKYHQIRLEFLTKIIENKNLCENSNDDKNLNFLNFKKKHYNIPKDGLINFFLQYLSAIFPELKNETISFCKTGALEIRSQTLKLWSERFMKFNFFSKNLEIFKTDKKDQKTAKYSFTLYGYVIKWIDKEKCLFSLDSINYRNKYKKILFRSKNKEFLEDWYENFKYILSSDKSYEFDCYDAKIEKFNLIENFQSLNRLNATSDELFLKKRYYSKSVKPNPSLKKTYNDKKKFQKSDNGIKENLFQNDLLQSSTFVSSKTKYKNFFDSIPEKKRIEENNKNANHLALNYSTLPSEEEFKFFEKDEINPPKNPNISIENKELFNDSLSSSPIHQFGKITENYNFDKMYCENNYEMISQKDHIRILRNMNDHRKFKLFFTLPYFLPIITSLFLESKFIKKWNKEINEYKILSFLSPEKNLSIIYEERREKNILYLKRFMTYQRFVIKNSQETTLICCKSINHEGPRSKFSIRGQLNLSILSISNINNQTKIAFFIDVDNKGFLTKEQNSSYVINYLNMFSNIRDFLENSFVFDFENYISIKNNITNQTIQMNDFVNTDIKLHKNILKKRKSFPCYLNNFDIEVQKSDNLELSQELYLKKVLKNIKENNHVINCLTRHEKQKKCKDFLLVVGIDDYLFVKTFWNILGNGKFEYLNHKFITKEINLFKNQIIPNYFSLPLEMHENLSELEKICSFFSFVPLIFKNLSEFDKPEDQMKIVIIFLFSFLFLSVSQKIPFASTLGETFQSILGDFHIFAEKISVDPDISFFLLISEYVEIEAKFNLLFDFNNNMIKIRNNGFIQISFTKTLTKFYATLPTLVISGIRELPRTIYYEDSLIVIEQEKCLISEIFFINLETFGGFLGHKEKKYNDFYGESTIVSKKAIELIVQKKNRKNENENEFVKKVHSIQGSLSSSIEFDGKTYWSFDKHYPYNLKNNKNSLPSDSQFRKDIIFYKLEILIKAKKENNIIRENEDHDKKLRTQRK